MTDLDLVTQTMFAELLQRSLDAEFDNTFDIRGTFRRKKSKGRFYWHHQLRVGDKVVSRYVGPVNDRSITDRVSARSPATMRGRARLACFGVVPNRATSLWAGGMPQQTRLPSFQGAAAVP